MRSFSVFRRGLGLWVSLRGLSDTLFRWSFWKCLATGVMSDAVWLGRSSWQWWPAFLCQEGPVLYIQIG